MTHIPATYRSPFSFGSPTIANMPVGATITEMVERMPDLPPDFAKSSEVRINGLPVPRHMWPLVKPKVGTEITFHAAIRGGGGSGDGGKSGAALIGSLVITLAAAAATGGAGASLLGLSTAAFGVGATGSLITGAAIGIPCAYIGELVRKEAETLPTTPGLSAALDAAKDPARAPMLTQNATMFTDKLRGLGLIGADEYGIAALGNCLRHHVAEAEFLVADPALPIRSRELALIRVRGADMLMGKLFLGSMAEVADSDTIYWEEPDQVYIFLNLAPLMLVAVAGQDLLATDRVVAVVGNNGRRDVPDMLTTEDNRELFETMGFIDQTPLMLDGPSAFDVDRDLRLGSAA